MAKGTEQKINAVPTLEELGYHAVFHDNDGSEELFVKVGINVEQFAAFLNDRGIRVENCSQPLGAPDSPMWGTARISLGRRESSAAPPASAKTRLSSELQPSLKSGLEPGSKPGLEPGSKPGLEPGLEPGLKLVLEAIRAFNQSYMVAFDLDGTLVDTTESFDTTVAELVQRHSGRPLPSEELKNLRAEGGFNNNWDAAVELIRRRGKVLTRRELDPEALEIYFALANEKEKLLVDLDVLEILAKRHPLFILTGRCQFEYKPVWESRLGASFKQVYCLDDLPHCKPKPAPDSLQEMLQKHQALWGVYVGNAFDDMWAARAADMHAIAVTTTHSAVDLVKAGAQLTYEHPNQILEAFLL